MFPRRRRSTSNNPLLFRIFFFFFCILLFSTNRYSHPISPPHFNFHDSLRLPELTIIISIYNKVHYLNRSLSSILNLTISPHLIRILCVDDGSTDNSFFLVKKFQSLDPRIFVHRNPRNLGTHITRISGVLRVTTPYLTFLDPDDLFVGTGLEVALARIRSKNLDIVEFECRIAFPPNLKCLAYSTKTSRAGRFIATSTDKSSERRSISERYRKRHFL
jgi:glycosyltransferase involved in cell wall biosynthesis